MSAQINFKSRFKKFITILLLGFVLLFLFRLGYGYTQKSQSSPRIDTFLRMSEDRRNYASTKYEIKSSESARTKVQVVDQKYEKVAEINTKSSAFEEEEKKARNAIKQYEALIQFEQKSGQTGRRNLNFLIGVPPENFDNLYQDLITIGNVEAKQITKKDKTNEYRELNAKKASLEKIRQSLIELKSKGGEIEEYMQLENRILEVEQQLQDLGVSLGDFDAENEFCTVKFSLLEGKKVSISFMHRVKVALEWSIRYYLMLVVMLFFMASFVYLLLIILDKLKVIEQLMNK